MSTQRTFNDPAFQEKIRFRAYELFEQRGCEHGRDLDDWLQAESELLRSKIAPVPPRVAPAKRPRNNKRNNH